MEIVAVYCDVLSTIFQYDIISKSSLPSIQPVNKKPPNKLHTELRVPTLSARLQHVEALQRRGTMKYRNEIQKVTQVHAA